MYSEFWDLKGLLLKRGIDYCNKKRIVNLRVEEVYLLPEEYKERKS